MEFRIWNIAEAIKLPFSLIYNDEVKIFLTVPFSSRVGDDGNVESSDRVAVLLDERVPSGVQLECGNVYAKIIPVDE